MDQRPIEKRRDVLVYSTPPVASDLEVTGPIKAFSVASHSAGYRFPVKLVDVFPNGEARNLTDGILRMRLSGFAGKAQSLTPESCTK